MPRSSNRAIAAEEEDEGDDRPRGARGPSSSRSTTEPRVAIDAGRNPAGSESLLDELRRWSLCRTFVHQFRVMARREKPAPVSTRKGSGGRGWWRSYRIAPKPPPGLAAVKHAQQQARPPPAGKPHEPLPELAVDCEWPDTMRRELFGCRTVEDRLAWSFRWAEQLSGRAAERKIEAARGAQRADALWRASPRLPRADFG